MTGDEPKGFRPEGWRHFTFDELIHSDTADRLCIDNTPMGDAIQCIDDLVTNVLDRLRSEWGRPIIVTSGYCCKDNESDQCIFEHGGGREWIHISYVEGRNRRQVISI